jgi:hypothetical protein
MMQKTASVGKSRVLGSLKNLIVDGCAKGKMWFLGCSTVHRIIYNANEDNKVYC